MSDAIIGLLYQLLPILLTCFIAFAGVWLNKLKKIGEEKLGKDTAVLINTLIDMQAAKGISYAEEWARNKAKEGKAKAKGSDKLGVAVDFVVNQLEAHGFEDWAKGKSVQIGQLVEAKVFEQKKEERKAKELASV